MTARFHVVLLLLVLLLTAQPGLPQGGGANIGAGNIGGLSGGLIGGLPSGGTSGGGTGGSSGGSSGNGGGSNPPPSSSDTGGGTTPTPTPVPPPTVKIITPVTTITSNNQVVTITRPAVTITDSSGDPNAAASLPSTGGGNSGGLPTIAFIGIGVGALVVILFLTAAIVRWNRKGRNRRFEDVDYGMDDAFTYGASDDPFKRNLAGYHQGR